MGGNAYRKRGASRGGRRTASGGGAGGTEQKPPEVKSPAEDTLKAAGKLPATVEAAGGGTPALNSIDKAFDSSKGASNNFVSLDEFRKNLGGTRAEQDAIIRQGRLAGKWSLDSHEGMHGPLTPSHREASISEAGSLLSYISRR